MDETEELDFDFFETPRKHESDDRDKVSKRVESTPPRAGAHKLSTEKKEYQSGRNSCSESSSAYSTSDSESNYSDKDKRKGSGEPSSYKSSSPNMKEKYQRSGERDSPPSKSASKKKVSSNSRSQKPRRRDISESSSAYSNSFDSDNSSSDHERGNRKTKIEVKMPQAVDAWETEKYKEHSEDGYSKHRNTNSSGKERNGDRKHRHRHRHSSYSSDSDSSVERGKHRKSHNSHGHRSHSRGTKQSDSDSYQRQERPSSRRKMVSRSSSGQSGNSDITSVSSLESPENTPRESERGHRRRDHQKQDSGRSTGPDIKLDSDKIDLSILMKCMADIEKEKQDRISANSRKVMFAPPSQKDTGNPNYSFTLGRARIIEKENQRLLKQIMGHIRPGSNKLKRTEDSASTTRPVRRRQEPDSIHLVTPSAVNRQVEQRKIEYENRKILDRLQRIRPTDGMSRKEQLKSYERTADFAAATGILYSSKLYIPKVYDEPESQSASGSRPSSLRGSRPSSASSKTGKRSRPSSAKSNASQRSHASTRSNFSVNYRRGTSGHEDSRPSWNDRFSYN